jgi:hypothetical protein
VSLLCPSTSYIHTYITTIFGTYHALKRGIFISWWFSFNHAISNPACIISNVTTVLNNEFEKLRKKEAVLGEFKVICSGVPRKTRKNQDMIVSILAHLQTWHLPDVTTSILELACSVETGCHVCYRLHVNLSHQCHESEHNLTSILIFSTKIVLKFTRRRQNKEVQIYFFGFKELDNSLQGLQ